MPRLEDGVFQINKMDNGFLCRLKTIIDTKTITDYYKNVEIDISPVDLCAKAILKLLSNKNSQTIYHINNNNLITVDEIIKGIDIEEVTAAEQIKIIRKTNNPYYAHLLNDLNNKNYIETKSENQVTLNKLNDLGFKWKKVETDYLKKILEIIKGE